ncbi:MAG: N-acyl homoserine lactone hydrolase [Pseudonocardiales bacterium]|jgi:N-acyl homoserine lactone hydrolase|nr:beta-lactamase domain protein [Pseudonocardia sp.]MDT7648793.1 N-acyl homoserine lactone hydrolase [Pseudonocardiales bacterium]
MEMYIIPLGTCNCPYEVVAPGVSDGNIIKLPVPSYLIKLDDGKNLLIDTGMSRLHITDPRATWRGTDMVDVLVAEMEPEDNLELRLAELDVRPTDIDYVINTHLHFDHAGNNDLFERASFFVQREHYDFAKDNVTFPNQYWNLPKLKYELLDGETELFPGIEVLLTPGHAPAHESVMVRLPETGNMVVCGDAVYTKDNLDHGSWGGQADPEAAAESAAKLQRIAQEQNATLLFGHDPAQAKQYHRSPQSYR